MHESEEYTHTFGDILKGRNELPGVPEEGVGLKHAPELADEFGDLRPQFLAQLRCSLCTLAQCLQHAAFVSFGLSGRSVGRVVGAVEWRRTLTQKGKR